MPDYIVGDKKYTEEEASAAASSMGLDLNTWKNSFGASVIAGNQSDPANAEANAGSENNQASENQEESELFGDRSSSDLFLIEGKDFEVYNKNENGENFTDSFPGSRTDAIDPPAYQLELEDEFKNNPGDPVFFGDPYVAFLKNKLENLEDPNGSSGVFMVTKKSYLENEIKRIGHEFAVQQNEDHIDPVDTYEARTYNEIQTKLEAVDEEIRKLDLRFYDENSENPIDKEFYDMRLKGYNDQKTDIVKYAPEYAKLAYEQSNLILQNIQKTDTGEAHSAGFSITSELDGEENIELTNDVKTQILNDVHGQKNRRTRQRLIGSVRDDAISETMGVEQKEMIINNAKMAVLDKEGKRASYEMEVLQNNILNINAADLTQAKIDEYNLEAEAIENNYYNLAAQYDMIYLKMLS